MPYQVTVRGDYRAPCGVRLFQVECESPRMVHAEGLTHRTHSRNSASSRAIPTSRLMERIENDPVLPVFWGKNQPGMVAQEEVDPETKAQAQAIWLRMHAAAVAGCRELNALGLHKQLANRAAEPWMYITVLYSATDWDNFFALRTANDAQPEIRELARRIAVPYYLREPVDVPAGYWSLPYVTEAERAEHPLPYLKKIAVARVARVSYLTHDGQRDLQKDLELHDQLHTSGHWSPFEHVASALTEPARYGNFTGWYQYRKEFADELRTFDPPRALIEGWAREYGMTEYLGGAA